MRRLNSGELRAIHQWQNKASVSVSLNFPSSRLYALSGTGADSFPLVGSSQQQLLPPCSPQAATLLTEATVNRSKGNRTELSKSELIQKSAYCRVSGRDMDLLELSAYGNVRRGQDSGGCNIQ